MDKEKLKRHVKMCIRKWNLKNKRIKCCAQCPFEEEIVKEYPSLKEMFDKKRKSNG